MGDTNPSWPMFGIGADVPRSELRLDPTFPDRLAKTMTTTFRVAKHSLSIRSAGTAPGVPM